jgi:hypothetical protein
MNAACKKNLLVCYFGHACPKFVSLGSYLSQFINIIVRVGLVHFVSGISSVFRKLL